MRLFSATWTASSSGSMTDLLDIDVWVALSSVRHSSNDRAERYWQHEAAQGIAFCRHSALGLVRVISQLGAIAGDSGVVENAWAIYRQWGSDPAVSMHSESQAIDSLLDTWVHAGLLSPRLWSDAYLAVFAIASNMRLVTFDRDFQR